MVEVGLDSNTKQLPRGTYSKIARRIRVSPQAVRQTYLGIRKSARISAAIEKHLARQLSKGVAA